MMYFRSIFSVPQPLKHRKEIQFLWWKIIRAKFVNGWSDQFKIDHLKIGTTLNIFPTCSWDIEKENSLITTLGKASFH